MPPRLAVRDIAFFERPVTFARPFRFGAVVINATPQMFLRVEIEVEGSGKATGATAEFLVAKWFDKRPHLSPQENDHGTAALAADRARTLSCAFRLRDGVRPACGVYRRADRSLCQRGYSAAGGGVWAG